MTVKTQVIDELGEQALLLPRRLDEALAANDRVKYCFALLQAAEAHALDPDHDAPDLAPERHAAGVDDAALDGVVAGSRRVDDNVILIPEASRIFNRIHDEIEAMLLPLDPAQIKASAEGPDFAARLAALVAALPDFEGDRVPVGTVAATTTGDRKRGDSLHILVMDLHRALNALQGELAVETVAGAKAYGLAPEDRPLVTAFMNGLAQTAPLKFDHPGLGTMATRSGGRLVIQNDIGTTDAHVLVLHVEGLATTLTYTDVHAQRAAFFRGLFKPYGVRWDDTRARRSESLAAGAEFVFCLGRFDAKDDDELKRYLAFLGSRIVFLIDWNRARKRLHNFVKDDEAVAVLKWAAEHNYGHRAFLKLGGERMLFDAIESAQPAGLRYGQHLYEALGADPAVHFLKAVLRISAEGLLAGRSERLIRDEIRAELARSFISAQEGLLALAGDHAAVIFELADAVREELRDFQIVDRARLDHIAMRSRKWEQEADTLVTRMRSLISRTHQPDIYLSLLREADDAADSFEEIAFLATLVLRDSVEEAVLKPIRILADLLVDGTQAYVRCLAAAGHVHRDGAREDLQDFLEAVDELVTIEHKTDDADRAVTATLVQHATDFRQLHVLSLISHSLEEAADALSRSALMLRDHMLNSVMAS
jgi:uncharacterized protein Yka (UPF0111/DUF47 family)